MWIEVGLYPVAVHVRLGDTVESGDPLLVLESMKIRNELVSPIDGTVRDIRCKVGDQVSFGAVLAEIAPER